MVPIMVLNSLLSEGDRERTGCWLSENLKIPFDTQTEKNFQYPSRHRKIQKEEPPGLNQRSKPGKKDFPHH